LYGERQRKKQAPSFLDLHHFDKMADQAKKTWQEELKHPLVSYILTVGSGGAALWYTFRKGPYRAWHLARSSKGWQAPVHSVRNAEVDLVRYKLSSLSGESYVVVRGPKGVGKTCIVDSVLEERPGVLRFDIYPGTTA
jgi:Cdc6-like AAA superfamily ATPase